MAGGQWRAVRRLCTCQPLCTPAGGGRGPCMAWKAGAAGGWARNRVFFCGRVGFGVISRENVQSYRRRWPSTAIAWPTAAVRWPQSAVPSPNGQRGGQPVGRLKLTATREHRILFVNKTQRASWQRCFFALTNLFAQETAAEQNEDWAHLQGGAPCAMADTRCGAGVSVRHMAIVWGFLANALTGTACAHPLAHTTPLCLYSVVRW